MTNRNSVFFLCNWLKIYIPVIYKTKEMKQFMGHGNFDPKGADLVSNNKKGGGGKKALNRKQFPF